jgi:hypothetical protein
MYVIARKRLFPPFQKLHIHVSSPCWLRIIQHCANTLTTLVVEVAPDFTEDVATKHLTSKITLPRLKQFAFNNFTTVDDGGLPFPVFRTPVLEEASGYGGVSPLHEDTSTITSLVLIHPTTVNWSKAQRVTYIRLRGLPASNLAEMKKLASNANLCPDISTMDCVQVVLGMDLKFGNTTVLAMQTRSVLSGKPIKLRSFESSAEYNTDPNDGLDHFMVCSSTSSYSVTHFL